MAAAIVVEIAVLLAVYLSRRWSVFARTPVLLRVVYRLSPIAFGAPWSGAPWGRSAQQPEDHQPEDDHGECSPPRMHRGRL